MAHKKLTSTEEELERWLVSREAEIRADEGAATGVEQGERQRCPECGQFMGPAGHPVHEPKREF